MLAAALVAAPSVARAGSAEEDARAALKEGLDAEKAGQLDVACGKYRRALDLIKELGPLKKVKECEVREGKVLAARDKLKELISRWPEPGPELDAFKAELAAVEARVAHLAIDPAPGTPSGTKARVDTRPFDLPLKDVELDPGEHEVLFELPGKPIERATLTLKDGERRTLAAPAPTTEPTDRVPPGVQPPPDGPRSGLSGLGIAGIVIGGLGVGGVIGGAITSPMVLSKKKQFDTCLSDSPGKCGTFADEGNALLRINGALYIAGIGLAAVGGTLLIIDVATMPSSKDEAAKKATLELSPTGAAVTLSF